VILVYDTLLDSDVPIWYLRGDPHAKDLIHGLDRFSISAVTHMELVQGIRNKAEPRLLKQSLHSWHTRTILIDEAISAQTLFYVEEYFLSHSMQLADALITANDKHYRVVKGLEIEVFRS
jgi:predicted nucleic acid-binding protein